MLPRNLRLGYKQAKSVLKTGKRLRSGQLELIYQPAQDTAWQIIVPKRVAKLANERNRLKRIFSEALMTIVPALKSSISGMIQVHKNTPVSFVQAKQQLRQILMQAGLV